MMSKSNKSHIAGLLALILFGMFVISMLFVLFTGVDVYKRLMQRGVNTYNERTVPQYIATKVRKSDVQGSVSVAKYGDIEVLELSEIIEDECYVTRIYCYEGYLKELFSHESVEFEAENGMEIAEADNVCFAFEKGCLVVTITQMNGNITKQNLALRSLEGGN